MAPTHTVREVLSEIKSLEPLPQVALRVLELSQREDLVPRELVDVIQTDAGTTAKVLKLCNSAYYGFRREIASLAEAGNLLGCTTLINLALTSCAGRYFRDYGKQTSQSAARWWERSITSALAASQFAIRRGGVDRGRAYTAGLLENVGHLVLDRFLSDVQDQLNADLERGLPRLDAERNALGMDHAAIGAELARQWDFPEILIEAIACHHRPQDAQIDPLLASVAHLGEIVMERLDHPGDDVPLAYPLVPEALHIANLGPQDFEPIETRLRAEIDLAKELIDLA